jgi:glutamate dehydrogenase
VQYDDSRGPFKGGIRFHPQVDIDEVKALAFWMVMKCSVAGIPLGGGKGGITVDPKKLSEKEIEQLSRAFVRALAGNIGSRIDVPAPDVNTNGQIMAWMIDEYEHAVGKHDLGAFTGKPIALGGSQGREAATGRGGLFVLQDLVNKLGMKPSDTTVAVQGFGNVGQFGALLMQEAGFKIVALSDSKNGIYNESGIDVMKAMEYKKKNKVLVGFDGCKEISNDELLLLPVNVLVPAALENQVRADNAGQIKAKIIMELANGPLTPEADDILHVMGVKVIPDILANAGGVTVSYFEWVQNLNNDCWDETFVNHKLKIIMDRSFEDVWEKHEELNIDMRTAAFVVALERIAEATKLRGFH